MANTPNKGYNAQATGTNPNTWGDVLNDEALAYIDLNLGGIVSKGLTSSNVTLSASESRNLICRLTGNISANIVVTTVALGMTLVENATTGAFTVSFGLAGTEVEIPQGTSAVVATSAGNSRIVADNKPEFASGTALIFPQTTAPTGWVAQSTNNRAIRIVSSNGGVIGGSVAFTTAFANQSVSGTVGATALTEAQLPPHTHSIAFSISPSGNAEGGGGRFPVLSTPTTTGSAGSGATHTHSFSGNAINLAVQYMDALHCVKS